MPNFIMNAPQTLILFKIASVILAMQKYLEGAVIDGPDCGPDCCPDCSPNFGPSM